MKRLLIPFAFFLAAIPVKADITHTIQSSAYISIAAPGSVLTRQANEYSVSGNGVATTDGTTAGVIGGLGTATNGVNALTTITPSQSVNGSQFSFSQSYTEGDDTVTAITVGEIPPFSNITSTSVGTAGTGTIGVGKDGALTLTPGTATGATITGQYTTTLTLD